MRAVWCSSKNGYKKDVMCWNDNELNVHNTITILSSTINMFGETYRESSLDRSSCLISTRKTTIYCVQWELNFPYQERLLLLPRNNACPQCGYDTNPFSLASSCGRCEEDSCLLVISLFVEQRAHHFILFIDTHGSHCNNDTCPPRPHSEAIQT